MVGILLMQELIERGAQGKFIFMVWGARAAGSPTSHSQNPQGAMSPHAAKITQYTNAGGARKRLTQNANAKAT